MNTSANEAVKTFDCKFPNCTNEVNSPVGRYSYCETHRDKAARTKAARASGRGAGTIEQRIKSLATLARDVDRAKAKARKLTEEALNAKHAADVKEAQFQRTMRDVLGGDDERADA